MLVLGMVKLMSKLFGGKDTPMGAETLVFAERTPYRGFEIDVIKQPYKDALYVLCHGDNELGAFSSRREAIYAAGRYSANFAAILG